MRPMDFISQKKRLASISILIFLFAIGAFLNSHVVQGSIPASSKIIYIDSAGSGLWQIDSDGQNKIRLADAPPTNKLVLSPNGQSMAFVSVGTNIGSLFVMDINGNKTQLVRSNQDQNANNTPVATVSWSPDGTRLLYAQWGTDYKLALQSAKLDGSDEQSISFEPLAHFTTIFDISWSPDGKLLLVSGSNDQNKSQAVIFNSDGTPAKVLYEGEKPLFNVSMWSPDGAKIAYAIKKDDLSSSTLYIANADGSNVQTLASDIDILQDMAWSPDKSQIAFWGYPTNSVSLALFMISVDGTNLHSLPIEGIGLVWTTIPG